jgi:predicted DNA-binding protein YlxM (UPF0122 family)
MMRLAAVFTCNCGQSLPVNEEIQDIESQIILVVCDQCQRSRQMKKDKIVQALSNQAIDLLVGLNEHHSELVTRIKQKQLTKPVLAALQTLNRELGDTGVVASSSQRSSGFASKFEDNEAFSVIADSTGLTHRQVADGLKEVQNATNKIESKLGSISSIVPQIQMLRGEVKSEGGQAKAELAEVARRIGISKAPLADSVEELQKRIGRFQGDPAPSFAKVLQQLVQSQAETKNALDELAQAIGTRPESPTEVLQQLVQSQAETKNALDQLAQVIGTRPEAPTEHVSPASAVPAVNLDPKTLTSGLVDVFTGEPQLARHLLACITEMAFKDRSSSMYSVVKDLPVLFDRIERRLAFWEHGKKLSEAEDRARDQVLEVLRDIRESIASWRDENQIDCHPELRDEPLPYNPADHSWGRSVRTKDSAKVGMISEVIKLGYSWRGEQLRKASVAVYDLPSPDPTRGDDASHSNGQGDESADSSLGRLTSNPNTTCHSAPSDEITHTHEPN